MDPFETSLEHVLAELERVDLFLRAQVHRARRLHEVDDRFAGLHISEQEVDALTSGPAGLPRWASASALGPEDGLQHALGEMTSAIGARRAATAERGAPLRLDELATRFHLDRFDVDVLLVCLAPEIDLRYERLFAYLQDDVQKRLPTVDVVLNLLCPTLPSKLHARDCFAPAAPLIAHGLIEIFDDPTRPHGPLLGKTLRVDARIAGFLLGSDEIDPTIARCAEVLPPQVGASISSSVAEAIAGRAANGPVLVHVSGPRGVGKRRWARAIVSRLGVPLLVVNGEAALRDDGAPFDFVVRHAVREASLRGAALYWSGFDALLDEPHRPHRDALVRAIGTHRVHAFLSGAGPWEGATVLDGIPLLRAQLSRPTAAERDQMWRHELSGELSAQCAAELPVLAAKFRFTRDEIRATAADACARALLRGTSVEPSDVYAACRARSTSRLGELAKKIESRYGWDELVLPYDSKVQLREICEQVRQRARVLEDWGFDRKLSLGKGLHALFSGPSGTGKTMAAEILARELGLELYKIDLSGVVSKYIGETEKNLARIFAEAEATSAILFFDEADALFGKRSDVKDAHDRYANIETSFLLQRMEEYEGVTILATNLRRNLDEAFSRRLAFVVQFPFPEVAERLLIWRGVFPSATPRAEDVDLEFMARQFKLAGGSIKNVALAAAFLAATAGEIVSMAHLVRATKRELQKAGRAHVNAEFGEYSAMLEPE